MGANPPPVQVSERAFVSVYIRLVALQTWQPRPGPSQGSRLMECSWADIAHHHGIRDQVTAASLLNPLQPKQAGSKEAPITV